MYGTVILVSKRFTWSIIIKFVLEKHFHVYTFQLQSSNSTVNSLSFLSFIVFIRRQRMENYLLTLHTYFDCSIIPDKKKVCSVKVVGNVLYWNTRLGRRMCECSRAARSDGFWSRGLTSTCALPDSHDSAVVCYAAVFHFLQRLLKLSGLSSR